MKDLDNQELFEAYYAGTLNAAARAGLERQLLEDAVLRKEWELFQEMAVGIEAYGRMRIRQKIREAGQRHRSRQARRKQTLLAGFSLVFFAAVVLIAVGWKAEKNRKLWQMQAQSEASHPMFLLRQTLDDLESKGFAGKTNDTTPQLLQGLQALEKGKYEDAVLLLERTAVKNMEEETLARFFLGHAYLGQSRQVQAIQSWERVPRGAPGGIWEEARYQSALAWAQRPFGQPKAKSILRTIAAEPGNRRRNDAQRLLKKIE